MSKPSKPLSPAAAALKAALAAKKPAGPGGKPLLRADKGEGARAQKDAERLAGKSRKVH